MAGLAMTLLELSHKQLQLNSRLRQFAEQAHQQAMAARTAHIASLNESTAARDPVHYSLSMLATAEDLLST